MKRRWLMFILGVIIALVSLTAGWFIKWRRASDLEVARQRMRRFCAKLNLPFPPPKLHVVVHKAQRRLELYSGKRLLKRYRIALGFNPIGDKKREGDGRTPEGKFYVCEKHRSKSFYLFIGISYPSVEDAERGLRSGIINRQQYDAIVRAINRKRRPPWNTPLGGEIGIHGGGAERDWTLGCIAMSDADVAELYVTLQHGDSIVIKP